MELKFLMGSIIILWKYKIIHILRPLSFEIGVLEQSPFFVINELRHPSRLQILYSLFSTSIGFNQDEGSSLEGTVILASVLNYLECTNSIAI